MTRHGRSVGHHAAGRRSRRAAASTKYVHEVRPRSTSTKYVHEVRPRSTSTKYVHEVRPRSTSTKYQVPHQSRAASGLASRRHPPGDRAVVAAALMARRGRSDDTPCVNPKG